MSIAPVSTNSNSILSPLSDNNAIKLLEKQKMQLQEQIQKTNVSKMDDKTKQDRIKQLQDQVQQIDIEIQQKQRERLDQSQSNNQQAANNQSNINNSTDNEDDSNLAGMPDLMQASSTYSRAKIMNSAKNSLNGKGRILKKEIESDESRSLSGSKAVSKRQELQEIESREQILGKKVAETTQTAHNQVKAASRKESENSDASNKDKNEINSDTLNTSISNNPKTQDIESVSYRKEENSQQQELKGTDKIYKRVDVKV